MKDEAEARRVIASKVNDANEKAVTIQIKTMPNPRDGAMPTNIMYATDNFQVNGLGRADGKYFATSITHTLNSSGYTQTISGYKVFNRL